MKNLLLAITIPILIVGLIVCYTNKQKKEYKNHLAVYLPKLLNYAEQYNTVSDSARILSNKILSYENAITHEFTDLGIPQSRLDSCCNHLSKMETAWKLKEGKGNPMIEVTMRIKLYGFNPKEIKELAKVNSEQIQKWTTNLKWWPDQYRVIDSVWCGV
jgi:hypothetical protein